MPMMTWLYTNGGDGSVLYMVTLIILLIVEVVGFGWILAELCKDWAEDRRKEKK